MKVLDTEGGAVKLQSEQSKRVCFYKKQLFKVIFLTGLLPAISMADDHEQTTLPFLVWAEVEEESEFNEEDVRPIVIYDQTSNVEVLSAGYGSGRLEQRVDDIPVQALADLKAKMDEVFDLMGSSQDSDYNLETIELHVTANAEGGFFIASGGIEGGMKLVFKKSN